MPEPSRRDALAALLRARRTRRAAPAVIALAAAAIATGAVVGAGAPATSKGATKSHRSSGSATVERRDLVATDTEAGTLGYADQRTVFNRLSGTITWLPAVGTIIRPGQRLFAVSGQPVILLDGDVPAYRKFASGMSDGADVAELKRNLIALGFDPDRVIVVDDTFDAATVDAIDRWQASLGETQTGQIPLGDVVFLHGSRRVDSVSGVLGSTGGGGGASGSGAGSGSAAGAAYVPGTAHARFVDLTTTTTTTTTVPPATPPPTTRTAPARSRRPTRTPSSGASGPSATQLLQQLVAQLKRLSAGASAGAARSSTGGGSGTRAGGTGAAGATSTASSAGAGAASSASGGTATAIMQTTSADLVVTVNLDATKQSEATVGEPVTVQLPDGSTTTGRITQVSSVAQSSSSSSAGGGGGGASSGTPSATVPVTIALTGRRPVQGLDQAAVSVSFQQQVERGVLSVPVTALLATAGGGYAVQTAGPGPARLIPVTPGLFAGGYVEVSGAGLVEGMQVTDSQG